MKKYMVILLLGVLMLGIFGCARSAKYSVDYCGQKEFYKGAKDSYKVGDAVHLEYGPVATDTNYSFSINVDSVSRNHDDLKGIIIEFVMPDHDVTIECTADSGMVYSE